MHVLANAVEPAQWECTMSGPTLPPPFRYSSRNSFRRMRQGERTLTRASNKHCWCKNVARHRQCLPAPRHGNLSGPNDVRSQTRLVNFALAFFRSLPVGTVPLRHVPRVLISSDSNVPLDDCKAAIPFPTATPTFCRQKRQNTSASVHGRKGIRKEMFF